MSSRAAGSKTTALLRHPYNLQSKLCDKCQTSQNMSKYGNLQVAPSELPHLRFAKSRVMWPCGEKSRCFSASKAEVLRPRLRGLNRNMAQRMQRIDG